MLLVAMWLLVKPGAAIAFEKHLCGAPTKQSQRPIGNLPLLVWRCATVFYLRHLRSQASSAQVQANRNAMAAMLQMPQLVAAAGGSHNAAALLRGHPGLNMQGAAHLLLGKNGRVSFLLCKASLVLTCGSFESPMFT